MKYLKTYESFNVDNLKQWFGDSKMVDKNNLPKVFYHGVGKAGKFDTFREDLISSTSGNSGHFGKGFYFTDSKSGAKNFSIFYGGTGEVMEVYLNIENPFIVNEENLIELGEKYKLNLPNKMNVSIDMDDLLLQLKEKDLVAYELLSLVYKHKDYSKGWKEFLSNHNDVIPQTKLPFDLNTVSDWYEDTQYERYDSVASQYTIDELKSIGIEPKFKQDYTENIRMDYLTDLGNNSSGWTSAIKNEGYDGIVAGDEIVVFESNQIKSVENNGHFNKNSDNIFESIGDNLKHYKIFESLPHVRERNDKFKGEILPQLEKYCSKYLTEYVSIRNSFDDRELNETDILYRGYNYKYRNDDLVRLKRRKDRTPMGTDMNIHDAVGELSEEMFGWNMRTEGIFSMSNKLEVGIYGEPYIFLPIGDYEYLFNKNIDDLTRVVSNGNIKSKVVSDLHNLDENLTPDEINRMIVNDYKTQMKDLISMYQKDDLSYALVNNLEVSFNCDEYFILNMEYLDLFIDYLNNI